MKTIEIVVSPKGETRLETRGFSGAECREASSFLEEALGARTAERLTDEFHQTAVLPRPLRNGHDHSPPPPAAARSSGG